MEGGLKRLRARNLPSTYIDHERRRHVVYTRAVCVTHTSLCIDSGTIETVYLARGYRTIAVMYS
jgi:hypothetical protein